METQKNVFLNCPFDEEYSPLSRAAVFMIVDSGFNIRCALEASDASQIRKIYDLIGDCEYGIHDLSRESDVSRLIFAPTNHYICNECVEVCNQMIAGQEAASFRSNA